jgi:hypothetical protein
MKRPASHADAHPYVRMRNASRTTAHSPQRVGASKTGFGIRIGAHSRGDWRAVLHCCGALRAYDHRNDHGAVRTFAPRPQRMLPSVARRVREDRRVPVKDAPALRRTTSPWHRGAPLSQNRVPGRWGSVRGPRGPVRPRSGTLWTGAQDGATRPDTEVRREQSARSGGAACPQKRSGRAFVRIAEERSAGNARRRRDAVAPPPAKAFPLPAAVRAGNRPANPATPPVSVTRALQTPHGARNGAARHGQLAVRPCGEAI